MFLKVEKTLKVKDKKLAKDLKIGQIVKYPESVQKIIYTTNLIEQMIKEIGKRTFNDLHKIINITQQISILLC